MFPNSRNAKKPQSEKLSNHMWWWLVRSLLWNVSDLFPLSGPSIESIYNTLLSLLLVKLKNNTMTAQKEPRYDSSTSNLLIPPLFFPHASISSSSSISPSFTLLLPPSLPPSLLHSFTPSFTPSLLNSFTPSFTPTNSQTLVDRLG